ncbi:MAG TPA: FtsQ-type POTRA domain-containing protein [Anaeromyxobacter sp.]
MDRDPAESRRQVARTLSHAALPLAAALLLAGAGWLLWVNAGRGDFLRIREVRFEGISRATAQELLELSPVQRGDHLLLVDPALVEDALRRHPWVASAEVRRTLPPALAIRIVERRAAAIVDLGALYLVDTAGEVFKRARPGDGLDLPVITGVGRDGWVDRRAEVEPLLRGALALLDRWAERGLDRRAPVSEIHVSAEYGTTLWVGSEGTEIRLGQGSIPEKLSRLERVLQAVEAEGRRAEVLHLENRRRPDWVAVRLAGEVAGVGGGGTRPRGR